MFSFFKSNKDTATTEAQASTTQTSNTEVREKWKALAADRAITREDIAALCLYRAMVRNEGVAGALSRLRKSFIPITNPVKLENGADPYGSLKSALWFAKNSTLAKWLTEDEQKALNALAQETRKELK